MNVWTCRLQFWQHGWKVFEKRPTNFHSMFQNDENKKSFHIKSFLKRFLRTRRMQFRQTHPKYISTKDQNVFCPTYKHDKNVLFFFSKNCSFSKCFYGHGECSLTNSPVFFGKIWKNFRSMSENHHFNKFFKKTIHHPYDSMDT